MTDSEHDCCDTVNPIVWSARSHYFHGEESGVRIDKHYEYYDDDGQSGSFDRVLSTEREILNALDKVFGK